jgi:poly-gamma-glutamate capsule biosynthesis protein CapA/YwtB (metallophosphatase superfamily)
MACPDQNQLSLAPKLAAAGASIIIGAHAHAHAHVLQGLGLARPHVRRLRYG